MQKHAQGRIYSREHRKKKVYDPDRSNSTSSTFYPVDLAVSSNTSTGACC